MNKKNNPPIEMVTKLLLQLRKATRRHFVTYGIGVTVICLAIWFWATLFLDKIFEPSAIFRAIILTVSAVWLIRFVYLNVIVPWICPISDQSMAQLCAKTFPEQSESILTAVTPSDPEGQNEQLWIQTCRQANNRAEHLLNSGRLFMAFNSHNIWSVRYKVILLLISIVGLHFYQPTYIPIWYNRVICLSNQLWPRQAKIWVDGFDKSANNPVGHLKIAKGDDLDLKVWADVSRTLVPERVVMSYQDPQGYTRSATMVRQGEAASSSGLPLAFTYTLRGVLNSMSIDFRGADAQLKGLIIDVVDSPVIVKAQLKLSYPPYMNRSERIVPVTSSYQLPFGVEAKLILTPNKSIQSVEAISTNIEGKTEKKSVSFIKSSDTSPKIEAFELNLGSCKAEQTVTISLLDTDGLKSRKDTAFSFSILPDAVPVLAISAKGLGVACTTNASIPFSGSIVDDYGVTNVQFAYTITRKDAKIAGTIPINKWDNRPLEVSVQTVFDSAKSTVQLDDSITLSMEASDGYNLPEVRSPNVGQTPQTIVEIVTPQRMRMILEAAELNLRRHFETVFDEVKSTDELVVGISTESEKKDDTTAVPMAVRILHADRAVQNARKNMEEFLAEAQAFQGVVDQMINNKIDTPEWKNRLLDGIALPLTQICKTSFVELEKRLLAFRKTMEAGDFAAAASTKKAALAQFDLTIRQLDEVLAKMLQMEDFNEAVELLRSIIKKQEGMESEMKKQQKESLQDLL